MRTALTVRSLLALAALTGCLAGAWLPSGAQNRRPGGEPPRAQMAPRGPGEQSRLAGIQRHENPGVRPRGEHLAEWMNQHSNLSPAQQQQALDREPGFHDLPQATQQRYHDRLSQLNSMPLGQRQRLLSRNEALERMSPDQRADFRGTMQQLGSLPPDQRRMVARTFRQLRDLPPDQRYAALGSDRIRNQFNDAQRSTLNNLMRIEPLLPPPDNTPR